jgi:hypothetical protein
MTGFWVQGGNVTRLSTELFVVPGLVARGNATVIIAAVAVSVTEVDEAFPIAAWEITAASPTDTPPLAPLDDSEPPYLTCLTHGPVSCSILRTHERIGEAQDALVDVGLLLATPRYELLVESRHADVPQGVAPMDLVVTDAPRVIAERVARGRLRDAP